ncbi:glycosyltransferase family 4 protein [Candidatus Nitrososphaera sp. FF02]|uniref:glycosyltransferase family 4 protein n=1 Tax=Candidatus Nitrososphaera sp. FF02 TaxID=3398226 RepID=UPI0039E74ABA
MHVLLIAQYFPPDFGGASTRAFNVAQALVKQGCEVTVITAFPHYPNGDIPSKYQRRLVYLEDADGIRIVRTWIPAIPHSSVIKRIILHFSFIFFSLFALRHGKKVDIIFAMNPNFFAFFPALVFKLFYRKEIIRNADDLWPEVFYDLGIIRSSFVKKILDSITSMSYRIPIAIIPVSQGYVSTILDKYKIPKEKVTVIEQGVDITKFRKLDNPAEKSHKIVMYSGVLGQGYDFDIVLGAAKLLESRKVQFIIRGKGELEEYISEKARQLDLNNLVISTDLLSDDSLNSFLNNADVFLLPMSPGSFDKGLPTKILEYQSLGKPIVCISEGEPARYIQETESGLTTDSRRPEECAQLILRLIDNEVLANRLGDNGLNYIRQNLTLEMLGKRLMEVILHRSKA